MLGHARSSVSEARLGSMLGFSHFPKARRGSKLGFPKLVLAQAQKIIITIAKYILKLIKTIPDSQIYCILYFKMCNIQILCHYLLI